MPITVFTDPHLDRQMQAHTTSASRSRLAASIYQKAVDLASEAAKDGPVLCAGDLFDRFQNSESAILQGLKLTSHCAVVMAGNHDVTGDANKVGSLELLSRVLPADSGNEILLTPFGRAQCYLRQIRHCHFVFVPHHATDELFQASLADAEEWAKGDVECHRVTRAVRKPAYLVLHCNYDSGYAVDETALNLDRKVARRLLEAGFDYILIGHDHHPREDLDGRVIVLGNTHPTGFGDISPKRALRINDDGSHTFIPLWWPQEKYLQVDATQLLDGTLGEAFWQSRPDFIDVTGKVSFDQVMGLSKATRELWMKMEPLALRNRVEIERPAGQGEVSCDFQSIDKVVLADLEGEPVLREMFLSYWGATAPAEAEEGE